MTLPTYTRRIPKELVSIAQDVIFSMPKATDEEKLEAFASARSKLKKKALANDGSWDEDALSAASETF